MKFSPEPPFGLIISYMYFKFDIINFKDGFDTLGVSRGAIGGSGGLFSVFMA